jgi:hypothetical protein
VKFAKSKQLQGPAHIAARGKCKWVDMLLFVCPSSQAPIFTCHANHAPWYVLYKGWEPREPITHSAFGVSDLRDTNYTEN